MRNNSRILGIDIGGSSLKAAIVNVENGVLDTKTIVYKTPNPASVEAVLEICYKIKSDFHWNGMVGCGFPGVIKKGIALTAPNLSDIWIGVNLEEKFGSVFSNDLSIINDADAAGLAEMHFGSGLPWNVSGGGVVLIITLGTGIGSSLFIDGKLVPNMEFGHILMNGVEAEDLAATVVRERENLSWSVWGERVNQYLNMMYGLLSPDCIIIGGGVSSSPEKFFKYISVKSELLAAQMGNAAGIVGAAMTLKNIAN